MSLEWDDGLRIAWAAARTMSATAACAGPNPCIAFDAESWIWASIPSMSKPRSWPRVPLPALLSTSTSRKRDARARDCRGNRRIRLPARCSNAARRTALQRQDLRRDRTSDGAFRRQRGSAHHLAPIDQDDQSVTIVVGQLIPGAPFRGFRRYIEEVRAHSARSFLHYNTWYDLAWAKRNFDQSQVMSTLSVLRQKLEVERKLVLDGAVLDDGWDAPDTIWHFHAGFPDGFKPVLAELSKSGTALEPGCRHGADTMTRGSAGTRLPQSRD